MRVHASTAMFYRCLPRSGYPVGALDSEARYGLMQDWRSLTTWATPEGFGGVYLRVFGDARRLPPGIRLRPAGMILSEEAVRAQADARSRVTGQWIQTQLKSAGVFWELREKSAPIR